MEREELEVQEICVGDFALEFYHKCDADSVMDAMEQRIKELELALSNSRKYGRQLRKRFNDYRQLKLELEATISKMETTAPKWISVKDRLPTSDTTQYLVYDAVTKEYEKSFFSVILKCFQYDATHWMPLPSAPTTEDSSAIEKEK